MSKLVKCLRIRIRLRRIGAKSADEWLIAATSFDLPARRQVRSDGGLTTGRWGERHRLQ